MATETDTKILARAHQIAAVMPDSYPFGFAVHLAQAEARGERMPWEKEETDVNI